MYHRDVPPSQTRPRRKGRDPPAASASSSNRSRHRRETDCSYSTRSTSSRRHSYTNNVSTNTTEIHAPSHQSNHSYVHQKRWKGSISDGDRPTRRKRRSSRSADEPSHYSSDGYSVIDDTINELSSPRPRRIKRSAAKQNPISITRLSRILSLAIVCTILYWGMGTCISLAIGANNIILDKMYQGMSSQIKKDDEYQDTLYEESHHLRGTSGAKDDKSDKISVHDLNAKSHLLKAEGRQIINDKGLEMDEDGKGDKEYMGHDITNDFFFAGAIEKYGRPAHTYAEIPLLLDSNPFAISLWINLSPLSDNPKNDVWEEKRGPRVILSTRSKGYTGCSSGIFSDRYGIGIILYAQPEYRHSYRIILEYTDTTNKSCRTLSGPNQNDELLVREDEWHHIVIFATRTSKMKNERLSMYINGDLVGRHENASRELSRVQSESKTIIGRYATPDTSTSNHFDLGGRVGMLAFWETGGFHHLLSKLPTRMTVQSVDDEDHVVRSIQRASFDINAIKELSLLGLFIKKPTLLYPLQRKDIQKAIKIADTDKILGQDASSELPSHDNCNELMSGQHGKIVVASK